MTDPSTDPLDHAWQQLQGTFDDPARHKAFIALAAQIGRLADAASRYRDITQGTPEDPRRSMAEQAMQWIVAQALASMQPTERTARIDASEGTERRFGLALLGIGAFVLLLAGMAWAGREYLTLRREMQSGEADGRGIVRDTRPAHGR